MRLELPYLNMGSLTALYILSLENGSNDASSTLSNRHRKRNDPAWLHLDWAGAEKWVNILREKLPVANISLICRLACSKFVLNAPVLTKLAGKGRESLVTALSEDELQVFRNAGLLDEMPTADVIEWWDEFRALLRKIINDAHVVQGREAERMTMEMEVEIVSQFGTIDKPVWLALNGDHYGYDILSYRKVSDSLPHAILIEVKSFASTSLPRIFLTRNEWNKAIEAEPNYFFVVWCMEIKEFKIYSVNDIRPHIPEDIGKGLWQKIEITIDKWWLSV
jgi:hypothetical protein